MMCFISGKLLILTILIIIISTSAGLRLKVTQEICGQSIDLSNWKKVIRESGRCVINITTFNYSDMICIKTKRRTLVNKVCSWILNFYNGGYHNNRAKKYTCKDLNNFEKPVCDSDSLALVVYPAGEYMFRITTVFYLFTKTHKITTKGRLDTSLSRPRLPRSLGSSVEDEYEERLRKKQEVGIIVGSSFLGIFGPLFCVLLCCCLRTPCERTDIYTSTPLQTYPQLESEQIDDQVDQTVNYASTSTSTPNAPASIQLRHSEGPPTYDQYMIHEQSYFHRPNQDSQEHTVELPPPEYKTKPSAPPPPYPGY